MTLARPSSLWLQNMWQSWPFWLAFVCLLYLTGAWFSLFLAFGIASLASLAYRTLINRRQAVSPGSAVFITGCSSGIGRATVRRLLDEGWLVFASVRRQTDADSLRTELRDHPMLHTLLVDVSDERQVEAAAAEVQSKLQERTSRLCAVVCNAGYAEHSPMELLPLSRLRAQFATNAFGNVSVVRHFLPLLRSLSSSQPQCSARVVLLSSITGQFSVPGLGAYCASKYAIEAIADSLRAELHHWNIAVALVQPGQTDTHFNATVQQTGQHLQQPQHDSDKEPVRAHYGRAYNRFFHLLLPADSVSSAVDAIELALTDSRPLARYRSGWTSLPTAPFLLLPTEIGDLVMGWWYR